MPEQNRFPAEHLRLEHSLHRGKWPDKPLTEHQCKAALAVVKANALNESDYEELRKALGL